MPAKVPRCFPYRPRRAWRSPYSPDLNPTEHCGSKIKATLRRLKPCLLEAFLDDAAHALKEVPLADTARWIIHVGYWE